MGRFKTDLFFFRNLSFETEEVLNKISYVSKISRAVKIFY